jgi:DNA-binding Xre family transcriptional regulator
MFKLNLDNLVRMQGKTNVVDYLIRHGKFSRSVARRLADPNAKSWRPAHLLRLCALFDCSIAKVVVYVGTDPNHPAAVKYEEMQPLDVMLGQLTGVQRETVLTLIMQLLGVKL